MRNPESNLAWLPRPSKQAVMTSLSIVSVAAAFGGKAHAQEAQPLGHSPVPELSEPSSTLTEKPEVQAECAGLDATIVGTKGDDRLKGTSKADVIAGLGGEDEINGLGGDDILCGDNGKDTVSGGKGDDRVFGGNGFDKLEGGLGRDRLSGGNSSDLIHGNSGRDRLLGGDGNDELAGGPSFDKLSGGAGSDWCREGESNSGCDTARSLARVAGGSSRAGSSSRTYTYNVNIEKGIGIDPEATAQEIETILGDKRGWTRTGKVSFKRVSGPASTQIILATPPKVDAYCYPMATRGRVSCRQGDRVILNLNRWRYSVPHWPKDSVNTYRQMLVNHEMGHRIGKGHSNCTGPGNRAPVMQQQTKDLMGCKANPWPLKFEVGGL